MNKIKREEEVIVITGKDKGKRGTVSRLLGKDRIIVAGVNMVKRHTKANPNAGQPGGIIEKEATIHISNVMMVASGKPTRVGYKTLEDGRKVKYAKTTGEIIN